MAMPPDDPSDRPTPLPPRPATHRLFTTTSESRRLYESQERILEALRSGVVSLVDRYFGDARDVVHSALLHASHDLYIEGIKRGRAQAAGVYEAYLDALHAAYAEYAAQARDPRMEPVRPGVTLEMLYRAVQLRGLDLSSAELATVCAEMHLVLASQDVEY